MSYRLGIDLGGTSAKIALVGPTNKIIREGSVKTAGFPRPDHLAKKMAETAKSLLHGIKPSQIGVGVAGDIDSDHGIVRVSPNLGWKKVPLKKLIEKYARLKVVVDNDANAAAWGLYKTQAPKSAKNVIVMTLGTGVGGGIIIDGKLLRGATGSAGEVGHMNIEEDGPLCNCGNYGCLETYVGGPHMVKYAMNAIRHGQKTLLSGNITPLSISQAARKGDKLSISIWQRAGSALGIAIGDLVYALNPQMIYFTGGVAQSGKLILDPMWAQLRKRAFKTPINAVKIKVADDASFIGVIGASLL